MPSVDLNYLAIIGSAVVAYVVGALWYSPFRFGKQWTKMMKFNSKDVPNIKQKAMQGYIGTFIATLVMAYVLAHFVDYLQATTFLSGMATGFWIWLGFLATTMIGGVFWDNKPFALYLLNVAHYLVALMLMGGILAVWV